MDNTQPRTRSEKVQVTARQGSRHYLKSTTIFTGKKYISTQMHVNAHINLSHHSCIFL